MADTTHASAGPWDGAALADAVRGTWVTRRSEDRTVTVTVAPGGLLVDLVLDRAALRLGGPGLARCVLGTVRAAAAESDAAFTALVPSGATAADAADDPAAVLVRPAAGGASAQDDAGRVRVEVSGSGGLLDLHIDDAALAAGPQALAATVLATTRTAAGRVAAAASERLSGTLPRIAEIVDRYRPRPEGDDHGPG